jgi:hypothetical protein
MQGIPYRRVDIRSNGSALGVKAAVSRLFDGPPDWWVIFPKDGGFRLRGEIENDRMHLVVLPKPWHRIGYVPVATGRLTTSGSETQLTLVFRPRLLELAFLVGWSVVVFVEGGPLWFALGAPLAYHFISYFVGFSPEVDRVTALLERAMDDNEPLERSRRAVER